jgi:methyltransferase family protein
MSENGNGTTQTLPPHVQLIQMATAYCASRLLYVAAKLGLADHLADGPKTADDLAGVTGAHPMSLGRVMRTLASLGVRGLADKDPTASAIP